MNLTTFASKVKETCVQMGELPTLARRQWIHKVFIMGGFQDGMSIDTFKTMLWDACNARHLDLARCDMVQGYSPLNVRLSQTSNAFGGEYHFIRF